jgi:hypothetical protein
MGHTIVKSMRRNRLRRPNPSATSALSCKEPPLLPVQSMRAPPAPGPQPAPQKCFPTTSPTAITTPRNSPGPNLGATTGSAELAVASR